MAVLTVQDCALTGLAESLAAAAGGGDSFVDNGKGETVLEVVNGGGGSINVTITAHEVAADVPGIGPITIADKVIAVGNGATKLIGPFPKAYRSAQNVVNIAYSGVTSVTVRAVRVGRLG
jgi:hypothetical protein